MVYENTPVRIKMTVAELIQKLKTMNPDREIADPSMGVMENPATLKAVVDGLIRTHKGDKWSHPKKIMVEIIETAKHHDGKPMLLIKDDPEGDVSIYHIEISEDGVVPYIFDDGVS